MSKNQVTNVNTQAVVGNFTQSELDTIKQTIAKGTTNEQFSLFVQTCVNSGLNPFLNHVHCIVYDGKAGPTMSIQIAVEGILFLARKTEGYKGIDAQIVHENDEFKFNAAKKEVVHEIGFPRGKIIGGYAIAKREGFDDVVVVMESTEVEHMKKGRNSTMWNQWFSDMFKKHIMKRAAKIQYGIEIAEDEPVTSAATESVSSYQSGRVDITPSTAQITVGETEVIDPDEELKTKWTEVYGKTEKLGWNRNQTSDYIKTKMKKNPKELTLQEVVGLLKLLDFELKQHPAQKENFDDLTHEFEEFKQETLL
ncbi:recombinase RecT [Priestia flexa]|uniref:RecT family recombinase n=1 Tax=Priestia flexa TaxID=86664 RepID=UPI001EF4B813|nr:RecT family recombinase [Priestia flexa]MCG7314116.1 recombinase RecT [Priestia flexa]